MAGMRDHVMVAGGGIAGLAAVRALHQRGVPAVAVEQRPVPADAGLAINLPGNGVRALAALGLGDGLRQIGAPVRRREYRTAGGRLLFAVDEDAFWGAAHQPRCVRRSQLLDLLGGDLPADLVRRDTSVAGVREAADGVTVTLADGTEDRYGFLVGADGVHSTVRDGVFGAEQPGTALLSAASWRFMAPNPGVDCWTAWSGERSTLLLIPVDGNEVYGFASALGGHAIGTDPGWLSDTFAGYPTPARTALASALERPGSLYHSPIEEVRMPQWHRGRVALVGDAAHAVAPLWAQGAALAVEDARTVAELLAGGNDWRTVGAEYDRRRRARVTHVQTMTDRLSRAAALPAWLRHALLPVIGPRSYRGTYGPLRTLVD